MIPLQITSRDFPLTGSIRSLIKTRVQKMETFFPRIVRCEVTISAPHRHKHKGKVYHVAIRLAVPGPEIVVSREAEEDFSHENLQIAIHDAFRAIDRRLEDYVRKMRGDTKIKSEFAHPRGYVSRVFPDRDYGFLQTDDGSEVYFHKNSLRNGKFERLTRGTKVQFDMERGDQGPQATFVRILQ